MSGGGGAGAPRGGLAAAVAERGQGTAELCARPRVLSGIQPTGRPHLGNYFGMMEPAIRLQDEGDAFYFVADYHALTSVHDPARLRASVRDLALDFLACGLDPAKATFFRHSDVPEVTELAWVLSTVTPMGLLERCHSYKDKTARGIAATHGLFAYPVLMAADILIYDSNLVPVGRDQQQHVEVTRDIAQKFNDLYGAGTLVVPEARIREATATVPGTDGQKMSKSYGNTVGLFDGEKETRKTIMRLVTDSTPVDAPKPVEGSLVLEYYRLFAPPPAVAEMEAAFRAGGTGYGAFKSQVFDALWEHFAPMRQRRAELEADPAYIHRVLRDGARRARGIAQATMARVRGAVGLPEKPAPAG